MTSSPPENPSLSGESFVAGPLRRYFISGWAFLIPYLLLYLVYYLTKWPVNPAADSAIPSLLRVYWGLHAIHLVLAAVAFRSWWRGADRTSALRRFLPWVLLALFFYIPGVYMEFPADPWQHYARINEWASLATVTQHSAWTKSEYFLAYSLIGRINPPLVQLKWFDVYYTACCLLMCWQYYRLARAVGLGEKPATLFVLVQTVIFGNNIFGFYRYYGMSTTIFAQLGAVALTRIALEFVTSPQLSLGSFFRRVPTESGSPQPSRLWVFVESPAVAAVLLTPLTSFSHIQGIGIAAIGVAAVICWRLVEWKRSMLAWLALTAAVLSVATILWYPRHPFLDSIYRPQGWLTSWYGFDFFHPSSPAFQRAWVIIGAFGALNLLAGLLLFRRNSVVAWLTWMPLFLLSLPCVAIPFASVLANGTAWAGGYIIAFHRMLFAAPPSLALVSVALLAASPPISSPNRVKALSSRSGDYFIPVALPISAITLLTFLPAGALAYNRLYNVVAVPPADYSLHDILAAPLLTAIRSEEKTETQSPISHYLSFDRARVLATPGVAYALNATAITRIKYAQKTPMSEPPSEMAERIYPKLHYFSRNSIQDAYFPALLDLFTPQSLHAHLSTHWDSNFIPLVYSTQRELFRVRASKKALPQIWLEWVSPRDFSRIYSAGAGRDLRAESLEVRGSITSSASNHALYVGDQVTFRPVLRTFDGTAVHLRFTISGPTETHNFDQAATPILDSPQWLFADDTYRFPAPGEYVFTLTGSLLWPTESYAVRYEANILP